MVAETQRLGGLGMATEIEDGVVCCHAEQDKVWVSDPAGIRWEVYTITDDAPVAEMITLIDATEPSGASGAACCAEVATAD